MRPAQPYTSLRARTAAVFALGLWLVLAPWAAASPKPAAPDPFAQWAAVVVAGEWHAAGGGATEGFDNARRDVAQAFERVGFLPANVAELSVRPQRYPKQQLSLANLADFKTELERKASTAKAGCLVYLTTHGSPYGAPVGDDLLTPRRAAEIIGGACGERPTVVIISACFSGVFVPALAGPNRLIMTAARRDRTSFGCGQDDRYPYYDACILKSLPGASDFLSLAERTRLCIDEREHAERLIPPSQPQIAAGEAVQPTLRADAFVHPTQNSIPPPRPGAPH